jgi:4-amino-4-deoxy-L-arabinose transferase-like glycosyltransferase
MNTRSKKSSAWALVLVALGMLALYGGPRALALLVPAAILIWYASQRTWRTLIDSRVDNRTVGR